MGSYLNVIADEADRRSYNFDRSKLLVLNFTGTIPVTSGQVAYEWAHLLAKLENRAAGLFLQVRSVTEFESHPIFRIIDGGIESWEILHKPKQPG